MKAILQQVRRKGERAYSAGVFRKDCPYRLFDPLSTAFRNAWLDGWSAAKVAAKGNAK